MELLLPIALIVLGLGLVAAEVYLVPGLNIFGVLGFLVLVFAIGFVFSETGLVGGFLALLVTVAAASLMLVLMWKTGAWNRFVLAEPLRADRLTEEQESDRARFLGMRGRAITPLRPTGVVEVDGERIEALTEGEYIAAGSEVKVVAMDRRRYFVRLARQDVAPQADAE